jgi:hypothetical protein
MERSLNIVMLALVVLAVPTRGSQEPQGSGTTKPPAQERASGWQYAGTPFTDRVRPTGPQQVPGRVYCAYYDRGGEGVAYHDSDAKNNGSGALNPADGSYLHEFRKDEGVDVSYTKTQNDTDTSPYNKVKPEAGLLYVGWTEPGEWFNVTVDAMESGRYTIDLLYTSNRGGTISLDRNGLELTEEIAVPTTFDARDDIAWRQWHHWNLLENASTFDLPLGRSVLTVHTRTGGNMNYATITFRRVR